MNNVSTTKKSVIAIDLFAGSGGLGEGLESAGIQVVLANELHPQPSLTYAINHPNTKVIVGDQRKMSNEFLLSKLSELGVGEIDLVVGGPPCQGFSTAGKKNSDDPRNELFRDFIRIIELLKPRMFMIENVPGFKKMYNGKVYQEALMLLSSIGYECKDTIIDASSYGIPQRRKRFIMVGRIPSKTAAFEFPQPTYTVKQNGDSLDLFSPSTPTVNDAIGDLAFLEPGWEAHIHQNAATSEYQKDRRNNSEHIFNHLATKHRPHTTEMFSYILEGKTISSVPEHIRSGKKTMARLNRHSISNTVLALPDDLIHYMHDRIPTVREMARLQTYDDDYVFLGKRTSGFIDRKLDVPQYTQVGNSVPPILAKVLGIQIIKSLGGETKDIRDINKRREFHKYIRGSSSYAGYTLDPKIERMIKLETVDGHLIPLPVSTKDPLVLESAQLCEWVKMPNPMRGQWSPNVKSRKELKASFSSNTQGYI